MGAEGIEPSRRYRQPIPDRQRFPVPPRPHFKTVGIFANTDRFYWFNFLFPCSRNLLEFLEYRLRPSGQF